MNADASGRRGTDTLDIVVVYPELLGLYGDRGNALALRRRAFVRGLDARIVEASPGEPVPVTADLYLFGGGEDAAMLAAYDLLAEQTPLVRALGRGAPCLAVCAGFQLLSAEFVGPDGVGRPGLGVIDARCGRLTGPRAVGEVVTAPTGGQLTDPLTGFENHQGDAILGSDAEPLAAVRTGVGNGHDGGEGAVQGRVIATYLHGPVLVRNPQLADRLLSEAVGAALPAWSDESVERLRRERLRAQGGLLRSLLSRAVA